jgi:hypothetical protein
MLTTVLGRPRVAILPRLVCVALCSTVRYKRWIVLRSEYAMEVLVPVNGSRYVVESLLGCLTRDEFLGRVSKYMGHVQVKLRPVEGET